MDVSAQPNQRPLFLFQYVYKKKSRKLVDLLAYGATPIGDPLGQIHDGFLKFRGKVAKGLLGIWFSGKTSHIGQHHVDMRWPLEYLASAFFDTNKELRLEQIYCLPLFNFPTHNYGWNRLSKAQARILRRRDVAGLLLIETGRKPGEFKRCGMFETHWRVGKVLNEALENTSNNAGSSGIPFEETKDGKEFIITIV
jgi:hypothetical protein